MEPIFLVRGGETPPPITPAGQSTPAPTPEPTGVPTLSPGYIAVISDTWTGNRARGKPSDAIGNVHIYYADEEIVGERAHFDGVRTMTITGHPFIVNHEHNSILDADVIIFDTIEQTAKLVNGKGASDEGLRARPRSFLGGRPVHRPRWNGPRRQAIRHDVRESARRLPHHGQEHGRLSRR